MCTPAGKSCTRNNYAPLTTNAFLITSKGCPEMFLLNTRPASNHMIGFYSYTCLCNSIIRYSYLEYFQPAQDPYWLSCRTPHLHWTWQLHHIWHGNYKKHTLQVSISSFVAFIVKRTPHKSLIKISRIFIKDTDYRQCILTRSVKVFFCVDFFGWCGHHFSNPSHKRITANNALYLVRSGEGQLMATDIALHIMASRIFMLVLAIYKPSNSR